MVQAAAGHGIAEQLPRAEAECALGRVRALRSGKDQDLTTDTNAHGPAVGLVNLIMMPQVATVRVQWRDDEVPRTVGFPRVSEWP